MGGGGDYFQVIKKSTECKTNGMCNLIFLTLNVLGIRQTGYSHLHKNNRKHFKIVFFWKRDGTSQITLC